MLEIVEKQLKPFHTSVFSLDLIQHDLHDHMTSPPAASGSEDTVSSWAPLKITILLALSLHTQAHTKTHALHKYAPPSL